MLWGQPMAMGAALYHRTDKEPAEILAWLQGCPFKLLLKLLNYPGKDLQASSMGFRRETCSCIWACPPGALKWPFHHLQMSPLFLSHSALVFNTFLEEWLHTVCTKVLLGNKGVIKQLEQEKELGLQQGLCGQFLEAECVLVTWVLCPPAELQFCSETADPQREHWGQICPSCHYWSVCYWNSKAPIKL